MSARAGLVIGWAVAGVASVVAVLAPAAFGLVWARTGTDPDQWTTFPAQLMELLWPIGPPAGVAAGIAIVLMLSTHALRSDRAPTWLPARLSGRWPALLALAAFAALALSAALGWSSMTDTSVPPLPGSVRRNELGADTIRDTLFPALATAGVLLLALTGASLGITARRVPAAIGMALGWVIAALAAAGAVVVHGVARAMQQQVELAFASGTPFGPEFERIFRMSERLSTVAPALVAAAVFSVLLLMAVHAGRWQAVRIERLRDLEGTTA